MEPTQGAESAGAGVQAQAEEVQDTEGLTNREAKDLEWVKQLKAKAARVDQLEREKAEREEASRKAAQEAEIKRAEDAKNYEEANRLRDEAYKAEIEALKKQNTTSELKAQLAAKDFGERGIDLLAIEYNPETHGDISDYVKSVTENEANKVLLKDTATRTPLDPMGRLPGSGGSSVLNNDQIKALIKSDKPEERTKGLKYLEDYYDKNGGLPPGYK
jgi:hypothetical protein